MPRCQHWVSSSLMGKSQLESRVSPVVGSVELSVTPRLRGFVIQTLRIHLPLSVELKASLNYLESTLTLSPVLSAFSYSSAFFLSFIFYLWRTLIRLEDVYLGSTSLLFLKGKILAYAELTDFKFTGEAELLLLPSDPYAVLQAEGNLAPDLYINELNIEFPLRFYAFTQSVNSWLSRGDSLLAAKLGEALSLLILDAEAGLSGQMNYPILSLVYLSAESGLVSYVEEPSLPAVKPCLSVCGWITVRSLVVPFRVSFLMED